MVVTQIKGSIEHHGVREKIQDATRPIASSWPGGEFGTEHSGSDSAHVMACNKNRQPKYVLIIQASDDDSNGQVTTRTSGNR